MFIYHKAGDHLAAPAVQVYMYLLGTVRLITRCVYTHPFFPAGHFFHGSYSNRQPSVATITLLNSAGRCDPIVLHASHAMQPAFRRWSKIHDGCFEPKDYQRSGKFIGVSKAKREVVTTSRLNRLRKHMQMMTETRQRSVRVTR